MSAQALSRAFPSVVWDAPLLRGLDMRARGEIEAAGRVRSHRAGDVVFKAGEPADALFVVASGAVTLVGIRRGDADAQVIRRAKTGETFGEEGTVATFATRPVEARCDENTILAEVPLVVLRRAVGRAGGAEVLARVERALKRAATLDLLRSASFTRALDAKDQEVLLDAARSVSIARGEHLYREGDVAEDAFLVADGLLQAQSDDDGKPRIEAYLSRGDLFGDEELADREPRPVSVVAQGPTWLVAIPRDVFLLVARKNPEQLERVRRVRTEIAIAERRAIPAGNTTAHVFKDLYRMRVARSLLVIDQDSCIRCGHCAWSCASVHDDGISRLVRRGDKIVVEDEGKSAPLLVPNSCQHCKNPSCMIDCPTGAIGRDARGEVFIREDLCTGCGSCAKACPWENIQMAPRAPAPKGPSHRPFYPEVAVKCDLCNGVDGGPACVASCPTQAIARIDPNAVLVPLRLPSKSKKAEPPAVMGARTDAWPWVLGAFIAGLGVAGIGLSAWPSGIASGVLLLLLVLYAGLKRIRGPLQKLRAKYTLSRAFYIAHLALGALTIGITLAHTGMKVPGNGSGALVIALALAILTGAIGALLSVVVPPALSRLERKLVLPEELGLRARELDEKIFTLLSGKSELVKTLFLKVLKPYRKARFGTLFLLLSRRSLKEEEKRVRAKVSTLLEGRGREKLQGFDDLVKLVVEHRATRVQRWLTLLLRGFLFPHLAATAAAIVLLVIHVIVVVGGPR